MKKTIDIIIAVLDCFKVIMLTFFSVMFGIMALGAFVSIFNGFPIAGIIGCGLSIFGASVTWSIRRD